MPEPDLGYAGPPCRCPWWSPGADTANLSMRVLYCRVCARYMVKSITGDPATKGEVLAMIRSLQDLIAKEFGTE